MTAPPWIGIGAGHGEEAVVVAGDGVVEAAVGRVEAGVGGRVGKFEAETIV